MFNIGICCGQNYNLHSKLQCTQGGTRYRTERNGPFFLKKLAAIDLVHNMNKLNRKCQNQTTKLIKCYTIFIQSFKSLRNFASTEEHAIFRYKAKIMLTFSFFVFMISAFLAWYAQFYLFSLLLLFLIVFFSSLFNSPQGKRNFVGHLRGTR